MLPPLKTVAVLIANPALSSILSMTLAGAPSLRVRPFESTAALRAYMQVAPVDVVVTDLDKDTADQLRTDITSRFQIIALASKPSPRPAGIDEIILKPMSPRYLVERVLARLAKPRTITRARPGLHNRDWSKFGDNIVPLFGRPEVQ